MTQPAVSVTRIVAAINAGHDDVFKVARYLGVNHTNYTLRSTLASMVRCGYLRSEDGSERHDDRPVKRFTITEPGAPLPVEAGTDWRARTVPADPRRIVDDLVGWTTAPGGTDGDAARSGPVGTTPGSVNGQPSTGCGATSFLANHPYDDTVFYTDRDGYFEWETCGKDRDHPIHQVDPPPETEERVHERCGACGWATRKQGATFCPQCRQHNTFEPYVVPYPPGPREEVVQSDTREIELAIIDAYLTNVGQRGDMLSLDELRRALPEQYTREQVDAALIKLNHHPDVHLFPITDHIQAPPDQQRAALWFGNSYSQVMRMEPTYNRAAISTYVQGIRTSTYTEANSVLQRLDAGRLAEVAREMGVEPVSGDVSVTQERIAQQCERNRRDWLDDAEQGRLDGTLLYRADHEPEWVATWDDNQWRLAREAAARLAYRAEHDPSWSFVGDRAARWRTRPTDGSIPSVPNRTRRNTYTPHST